MSYSKKDRILPPTLNGIPETVEGVKLQKGIFCLIRTLRETIGRKHIKEALSAFYATVGISKELAEGHISIIEHCLDHNECRWIDSD